MADPDPYPEELTPAQRATYERVKARGDLEPVHELLARYGPRILDFGVPYVVVAARNWRRSEARRARATRETPTERVPEKVAPASLWDPWVQVQANDELRRLASAMADLDDSDVLVLWRHIEGRTDREIADEWDVLGYKPAKPSVSLVAKRRERARERLRHALGDS